MGISSAFNISRIGLTTTAQWADLVSGNIANANSESYGRRSLSMTTTASGAVVASGVVREADASLSRMYRE